MPRTREEIAIPNRQLNYGRNLDLPKLSVCPHVCRMGAEGVAQQYLEFGPKLCYTSKSQLTED